MRDDPSNDTRASRTAACSRGDLTVTVTGEPARVYACCCLNCQKESGGSYTYSAFYPEAGVAAIGGECRTWRQAIGSGRGSEPSFCPNCGGRVFLRLKALPGVVGIGVGCFAEPDFPKSETIY
jgi:hypothetical protein